MRGETERQDVRHQWRRDNQDQHKAHETRHLTSECARSLPVGSCCRHTHSLHTTSRGSRPKAQVVRVFALITSMHESVTLRLLSSPFHPTSYSCYSPSISSSSCCPSTSTRMSSNTAYSANKEMRSTDASCSLTETALENLCSNLPLLEAPSCLHLLHLTCLFLVFLLKCCNGSSLKPALPMCDGRPFASPLFRRLAGRGAFFRGFLFRWILHLVPSLTRSVIASRSRKILYVNVWPMWHIVVLLLFCLWLQRSQSLLVQEIQSAKDIYWPDLFQDVPDQSRHMLTRRAHVLGLACGSLCKIWSIRTFFLSWSSQRRTTTRRSSSLHTFPLETEYSSTTTPSTTAYCRLGWMWSFPCRRSAVYYLEHQRSHWICFFLSRRTENSNSNISRSYLPTTTFYVSRKYMEETSISRLSRC